MNKIITEEQKQKIIELSAKGYNNRQIEIEIGMKSSTLQYWKNNLRDQGFNIPSVVGRPRKNSLRSLKSIATIEEMKKEGIL